MKSAHLKQAQLERVQRSTLAESHLMVNDGKGGGDVLMLSGYGLALSTRALRRAAGRLLKKAKKAKRGAA